jgi:hypothetical protein
MEITRHIVRATMVLTVVTAITLVAQEKKSGNTQTNVTGCLSGPTAEGSYVLKTAKGRGFEVGGNDELKNHVGHEVKLTGSWVKSGAEIGENESGEKNVEKHETAEHQGVAERHFKVSDIHHVSDTCSSATSAKQ